MAPKPITLELAGDEDKLVKAFKNVGKATDKLEDEFEDTGKKAGRLGSALDKTTSAADNSESKFMGLSDVASGLGDLFGIEALGPIAGTGLALADLSGGFAQLGPVISGFLGKLGLMTTATAAQATATGAATGAQTGLNVAMLANPIGLIVVGIIALIGVFVLLWTKVDGFKEAIIGVFNKIKNFVPALYVLGAAVDFVTGLFGKNKEEVKTTPGVYESAFADLNAILEQQRQKWQAWKDSVTAAINGILNPLENAREQSKVGFDEINRNLIDNTKFFEGWMGNLQTLTTRGFGALAQKMYELGPTAEKAVGEMVTKSDAQLTTMTHRFGAQGMAADRAFSSAFLSNEGLRAMGHAGFQYGVQFKQAFNASLTGHVNIPIHRVGPAVAGLAAGGPVGAGMPYVVGEEGPELFVPGTSGTIIPNGGGGGTTNIYVSNLDPAGAATAVVRALDEYESRNGARYARA